MLTVKGNKPVLLAAITSRLPAATSDTCAYTTTEHRSGQRIIRQIWTAEAAGIDSPDAAQVFRLRRDTFDATGQRTSKQAIHGITSLPAATAADLAGHLRSHRGIENKTHRVRDLLFGEDTQHAYLGALAHAMAALRNLAIALIRLAGHTSIKPVLERHHANKMLIPALLDASHP